MLNVVVCPPCPPRVKANIVNLASLLGKGHWEHPTYQSSARLAGSVEVFEHEADIGPIKVSPQAWWQSFQTTLRSQVRSISGDLRHGGLEWEDQSGWRDQQRLKHSKG